MFKRSAAGLSSIYIASTMSTSIPSTMRAIATDRYCEPSGYGVATLPVPQIQGPDEVLIKVHSTSINPIDVKFANGSVDVVVTSMESLTSARLE
jgi:hypothetical protein